MSRENNLRIAEQLLAGIGAGADPEQIASLFCIDVRFEIPGDVGALPWIGRKKGRAAVVDFIEGTRRLIDRLRFDVQDILTSEHGAAIVGELTSRIHATGNIIDSPFVLLLGFSGDSIARFQMLEDSFAVSRAAKS